MPREPLRLTDSVLAAYRPGALVAVAVGAEAGIPRKRPTPYALAARAYGIVGAGGSGGAPGPLPGTQTAIVPVRGVLTQRGSEWDCGETCGYDTIEADVLGAMSDPGVGQGILDIDSNGGDVPGLEETGARIRAALLDLGKPFLCLVNEACLSAAFWLAAMICDGIYLPRSGRIGSVGSIVAFGSEARRLVKEGVEMYVGRRPAGKAKPHPAEPLDDVGKARIDRLADEGAVRFFDSIAALRGIPAATVEGWNGDTFTGALAVDAGLADGVGSLEQVIALAESWPRAREAA